jgi:transglutaminase-like putative cysteine protease
MTHLHIRHTTHYAYRTPVSLWPHCLMLRPRESRGLSLVASTLATTPASEVSWAHDVFGNAVATARFVGTTDRLLIESRVEVFLEAVDWPIFPIDHSAINYPFRYSEDEWIDLGALTRLHYPDTAGRLGQWARAFVRGEQTDTLSLLKDLSEGVSSQIRYQVRDDEGTQTPVETLALGRGSCRDLAVLFVEAARSLGLGARIVSGYLHNPVGAGIVGSTGGGSTHAWAEIYLPGAGWISFDPTNRSLGGSNLIPVAVVRNIGQAVPVEGSFTGALGSFGGMSVEVEIGA